MKIILVTGASGFIGRAVCRCLRGKFKVIAIVKENANHALEADELVRCDITDIKRLNQIFGQYSPDVVVHCAGIAHQSVLNPLDEEEYIRVNSLGTEILATAAVQNSPDIHFIFLSSVSVYGEDSKDVIFETDTCFPSSYYAKSKIAAEKCLRRLHDDGKLQRIDVLRLAPVYDRNWTINLDKRVLRLKNLLYLKFGSGSQRISVLSRSNIVAFIDFILTKQCQSKSFFRVMNISDCKPTTFLEIIDTFRQSVGKYNGIVIPMPLSFFRGLTRIAGFLFKTKKDWLESCYAKLSGDLVFDNSRMLSMGFVPEYSLKLIFLNNKIE